MIKKIIKKIKRYLPISRRSYVETIGHIIKLLEANDENHKLIRNDLYQLAVEIRRLKEKTVEKKDSKKGEGVAYA